MRKMTMTAVLLLLLSLTVSAQNAQRARQILDKTASIIGRKGGASANFTLNGGKYGSTAGTIAIKGNKFHALTPQATVWFDGKTQWAYMSKTEEVNISNPNVAQQAQMNPYKFITLYKTGYTLAMDTKSGNYEVHLTAQSAKASIGELYITINAKTYLPSKVRMRQGKDWSTITISNFKAQDQPDSKFIFSQKNYPNAEVIDLR